MPALIQYDWLAAEHCYITAQDLYPRVSIKDISNRFNIPYQTVRRYAAIHKWVNQRDQKYYVARNPMPPEYANTVRSQT